jgi:hypothetical protein
MCNPIAFKMQISINNTLFARSVMIISKQQSADGTFPEDNRKLNRFEIESDEQCEQWLLPETIAIGSVLYMCTFSFGIYITKK